MLKDKTFRTIFSDSIPAGAVSSLASAIAQFVSKAFSVPRSFLLTLENDISMLVKNDVGSPEAYAEGIAISLTNLLSSANLITPAAIGVEYSMASKAISSGLQNYIGSSKVAGVGLGIGSNPYNSYFSVLSGLEMLPYVGPDAISRKYPPILKAVKASKFGAKFSKALYSNLISSSKFTETFVLGTPAPAWKRIAKILGKNMAEAFGSPNPSYFVDTYANALLSVGDKLSYKTYARVMAAATSKALYALGYFVSGNPNIQAAIASNAIVKALVEKRPKSNREFPQMSSQLGLPWMTQISGVTPPSSQTSTKDKNGINVDANVGLGIDAGLGLGVDLGLGANADLGLGANADLGLGLDVNANVDAGLGFGAGFYDQPMNGYMKRRRRRDLFDANAALGVAADVNANIGVNAGLDVGANIGLGVDANVGLGVDANLGLGVGANLGKGGKDSKVQNRNDVSLSLVDVLPQLLAEKLYSSTAMFTAMNIVGSQKVVNLIAQGFAAQFGLETAAAFSKVYDLNLANTADGNIAACIAALASATTNALGTAGILNSNFTLLTVDQLATAIVAKFSSLIATSLDSKDWNVGTKWSGIFDQDFIDPPLSRGYSYVRPNVFSNFAKSLDDAVSFDYNFSNSDTIKSRILL
ncbi:hypothetical protein JTE90_020111 [Oedothorax gibbosus]|nr:hypothetical protein JTE90_020111 [Oedothorax gibbosus]